MKKEGDDELGLLLQHRRNLNHNKALHRLAASGSAAIR
jgi:hypothetical protein